MKNFRMPTVALIALLFAACSKNNNVSPKKITVTDTLVTTILGNGVANDTGDGGLAINAQATDPDGIGLDASGNLYFGDIGSVRKIDALTGIVTTVIGDKIPGDTGDGGPALLASAGAASIAFDKAGNIYLADYNNHCVRRVDKASGIITNYAGGGTGLLGDGGPATSATMIYPSGIAFDSSDNLYIADWAGERIRRVDAATKTITTVAGDGNAGYNGDGMAATSASLNAPYEVAIDVKGNIIIADYYNSRIREVDASGKISTVAGTGTNASNGDGGAATSAAIAGPANVAVDRQGNIYISDYFANVIRKVTVSTGIISTFAGINEVAGFSDGKVSTAKFAGPAEIQLDATGNMYVADRQNIRIRKITLPH